MKATATNIENEYSAFDLAFMAVSSTPLEDIVGVPVFSTDEIDASIKSGFRVVPNNLSSEELDAWLCGQA